MERIFRPRWLAAVALAAGSALLLTGCLLTPGKFTSSLDLRKSGAFTYRYDGEIHLLALSKLAQMGRDSEAEAEFAAEPCYDEDLAERECTEDEIAQQKRAWDEGAAARKEKEEQEAASMRAMLGGIDPADPAAAEELAARLRRQVGWNRVDNKGDGLFDVSFSLTGRIDHDFLFPTIEGFPMSNFFVLVSRRQGGTVRVTAPGFAPQSSGNPFEAMMGPMMAGGGASSDDPEDGKPADPKPARIPVMDGTFTITTDGEILANNTDEGPVAGAAGKTLAWPVNVRTRQPPTALIRIE